MIPTKEVKALRGEVNDFEGLAWVEVRESLYNLVCKYAIKGINMERVGFCLPRGEGG